MIFSNSAQHHHDDYIRLEREKKLQEDDWRTNRTELENERDELKTELFKLRHKYDKVSPQKCKTPFYTNK